VILGHGAHHDHQPVTVLWSAVVASLPGRALSDLPLRRVFSTRIHQLLRCWLARSGVLVFLTLLSDELFALCLYPA
jgi:hypothetical protein